MKIKFDGSPLVNKQQVDNKKKSEPGESAKKNAESTGSSSNKKDMADIISIRNENKLAASQAVKTMGEAEKLVEALKNKFAADASAALDAHVKTDADTVMQYYTFE